MAEYPCKYTDSVRNRTGTAPPDEAGAEARRRPAAAAGGETKFTKRPGKIARTPGNAEGK